MSKLSGNCIFCKAPHTEQWMLKYLECCEKINRNPLNTKYNGIACEGCVIRNLVENIEDKNPIALKLLRTMRRNHLGIKLVK